MLRNIWNFREDRTSVLCVFLPEFRLSVSRDTFATELYSESTYLLPRKPLLYKHVLEISYVRKLPTVVPMVQYVRSTRFSVEGTLERPNAHSRRLLSRSASYELVNVKILNGGYEDKTCVSSFTNQITQQLFGPQPPAAEQHPCPF